MSHDGIDMARSTWTNPEGFQSQPRPFTPVPPVPEVCGAKHPDGWECELPPAHKPINRHRADDGMPGGVKWETELHDVSRLPGGPPEYIEGRVITEEPRSTPLALVGIEDIARKGLDSDKPSEWAIALSKIIEVCRAG
jgi:hypothetical protein